VKLQKFTSFVGHCGISGKECRKFGLFRPFDENFFEFQLKNIIILNLFLAVVTKKYMAAKRSSTG